MAIEITSVYGIEWTINNGTPVGPVDEETGERIPNPAYADGYEPWTVFTFNSVDARLQEGPEPLTGYRIDGKVFLDTRTLTTTDPDPEADPPDPGGEVVSDVVARTYPPYSVTSMTFDSNADVNYNDPENPAKPRQFKGPIIYELDTTTPLARTSGQTANVGILDNSATMSGFVFNSATLPATRPNGDLTFYIALDTGIGWVWADTGAGYDWCPAHLSKNPAEITSTPVDSVSDLDEADHENGDWAATSAGVYGTMYSKSDDGWTNIGPIQGPGPIVTIPDDQEKTYVSGYIYSQVFDQSEFRYVPRLSGGTQTTYQGDVSIDETGWFPALPYDVERNIYPMDSVTAVLPDERESVTITYTAVMNTALANSTATITQVVNQPTTDWGDLIDQLLSQTYFYNNIYH